MLAASFAHAGVFLEINANIQEKNRAALVFQGQDDYTRNFVKVLANDLNLSGWFEVASSSVEKETDYQKLLSGETLDVQVLIAGKMSGNLEVKVFDTQNKNILYQGNFDRNCSSGYLAHSVNDDIILKLTGRPGIARSRIAFVSVQSGARRINVCDYDGENITSVLSPDFTVNFPRWFPDNKKLLYLSYRSGFPGFEAIDLRDGKTTILPAEPGLNACASFFWHKEQFAAVLSRSGNPGIYIMDLNARIIKKIVGNYGINASPCVSPDDRKIIFVSDMRGGPRPLGMRCFGLRFAEGRHQGRLSDIAQLVP